MLLAVPLQGQFIQSPYQFVETRHALGFYGGYLDTNSGGLNMAPRSAPYFGARYNMRFTGPLSGEVAMGFSPAARTIYSRGFGDGTLEAIDDTSILVMTGEAGLRFDLTGQRTWNQITPYFVATGGFVADLTSGNVLESEIPIEQFFRFGPGFAIGAGVGIDYFLNERAALRAEVRDYLWRITYPAGITGTGRREEEWVHNFAPSLGLSYHF